MGETVDSDVRGWFPIGSPDGSRVLLVGDDLEALTALSRSLRKDGHMVLAVTGRVARQADDLVDLDLAVLDGIECEAERIELFKLLAGVRHVPVAVVDHGCSDTERLLWLALGARDVMHESAGHTLVDEIEAVLERDHLTPEPAEPGEPADQQIRPRAGAVDPTAEPSVAAPVLHLNLATRTLDTGHRSVQLSRQECALVEFLLRHRGEAFDRRSLLEAVWGTNTTTPSSPSTVTVQIRRIREKIEDDPSHPTLIRTVWGVGYCVPDSTAVTVTEPHADQPSGIASHH